ncbi:39S ribosomal protein L48, mitochondrial-like isoform X2 [Ostrea edulis]|uniref:39S ribosomal protein L48, mitochondrial-like isoform X2 n=1 Tax=Ostrea edulis TaxID=37623 RepID=UPI002095C792|nr:39S ribosomal protein L48, mitochondrial-like isoform X2 [Ostrea edulis]
MHIMRKVLHTFSSELKKTLCKRCQNSIHHQRKWFTTGPKLFGVWEPEGLDEPKIGQYQNIDIQLRGYDYAVLEYHCQFLKSLSSTMAQNMTVIAIPPRSYSIKTYYENSTKVLEIYNLKRYERKLRFDSVLCTKFTPFLEVLRKSLPAGVDVQIMEFTKEEEEFRYIPSDEKLKLLDRLRSLEKEKLERERRKD